MKGEYKGDFSRDAFDPSKHFLRVLMQQGRVSLDADWNEQMDILLHYMHTLARDLIGPFAGPGNDLGFGIGPIKDKSFNIGYGRYYVHGILCENEKKDATCEASNTPDQGLGYYGQPDYPIEKKGYLLPESGDEFPLLVYMDVWERHISYVEDDDIREKALGGPDTASRSKVVWQVKTRKKAEWLKIVSPNENLDDICNKVRDKDKWRDLVYTLQPPHRGCLVARADKPKEQTDPCITSPEARYRGEENQLYRVEIHRRGQAGAATFKWSRDNGSVIFPIIGIDGNEITLEHMGRDDRLSLKVGDWVEVIDDAYTLLVQSRPSPLPEGPRPLARVDTVDLALMKVTLKIGEDYALPAFDQIRDLHPLLRRWDYRDPDPAKIGEPELVEDGFYALAVEEGTCEENGGWLSLEDGVQVCFLPSPDTNPNVYETGDYWLIPARTATGDVVWPRGADELPVALPPHGVDHHYAPLAVLKDWTEGGKSDCRCKIIADRTPLTTS